MFNIDGLESPLIGLMHWLWTGEKSANVAPIVDSLNIEKFVRYNDIFLNSGSKYSAMVTASDADRDSLTYKWEIRREAVYSSYAGQGEKVPQPVPGLIKDEKATVNFLAPSEKGTYRLFVYVFDDKSHFSTANLPFTVR
jgi:hypothetical protein